MVARVRDWGLVIAAGSMMMVMLYIGWLTLVDGIIYKPVLEFSSRFGNVLPTDKEIYKPGDIIKIRLIVHKNRNISGRAYWKLIDSIVFSIPCQDATLPAGVHDKYIQIMTIPKELAPGEYYLAGIVDYKVNWLRNVSYGIFSKKFRVLGDYAKSAAPDIKNCPEYHFDSEEIK